MITIGICDDEQLLREQLRQMCREVFEKEQLEYQILEFASGEEVLAYEGDKVHLLFLDIEMPGINGIQVMRSLEDTDRIWRVVFVSSHQEMVYEAFGLRTLGFGVKPVKAEQVEKWIHITMKENSENITLECIAGQEKMHKQLEQIYYWQANGNYTYLAEQSGKTLVNCSLKMWEERLATMAVVRVHKSYLVNMNHVKKWDYDKVWLTNDEELAIGRLYQKKAKEKYLEYVKKSALGRV
ncbi:MAG: response regulator transcription factor [Lachnospiraceae bacterium]|nr:response regulator transcription factor [Lachnospiraceae bacterium]